MEVLWCKFTFMGPWNASVFRAVVFLKLMDNASSAGAGKSVIWYDNISAVRFPKLMLFVSSATIEDIRTLQKSGLASLAFFYCDFTDDQKKDRRGLLSSLLVQLGEQSDAYSTILSKFYEGHRRGSQQSHASDSELTDCLKDMLKLPGQAMVHIIIDALDECPSTTGMPSAREKVLKLVEGLVNLYLPDLRICVTSRPEADIVPVLDPLAFRSVSLHAENGQIQDIAEYIKSQVKTDPKIRAWRDADKELVMDVLTDRSYGMQEIRFIIFLALAYICYLGLDGCSASSPTSGTASEGEYGVLWMTYRILSMRHMRAHWKTLAAKIGSVRTDCSNVLQWRPVHFVSRNSQSF